MNKNTTYTTNYTQTYSLNSSKIDNSELKELKTWWNNLSETWKQVFLANLAIQKKSNQDYNYFRSPWDNYMKSFYSAEDIDNPTLLCILNLTEINCNYTQVNTLKPLEKLKKLKEVRCIGNNVFSLRHLENLSSLEVLICFDSPISKKERRNFSSLKPNCLILY